MWSGGKFDSYNTQENGHGWLEIRVCIASDNLSSLGDLEYDWPELKTIGIVTTIRQENGEAFDPKRTLCCGITSVLAGRKHESPCCVRLCEQVIF